jgi:hypothetical protein
VASLFNRFALSDINRTLPGTYPFDESMRSRDKDESLRPVPGEYVSSMPSTGQSLGMGGRSAFVRLNSIPRILAFERARAKIWLAGFFVLASRARIASQGRQRVEGCFLGFRFSVVPQRMQYGVLILSSIPQVDGPVKLIIAQFDCVIILSSRVVMTLFCLQVTDWIELNKCCHQKRGARGRERERRAYRETGV